MMCTNKLPLRQAEMERVAAFALARAVCGKMEDGL